MAIPSSSCHRSRLVDRYSTKAYTQHISTIGTSLNWCWAHLSPRVRVWLTSLPTYEINQKTCEWGVRVALMSDILKVSAKRSWDSSCVEVLNHPTPFISAAGTWSVRVADCLVLQSGSCVMSRVDSGAICPDSQCTVLKYKSKSEKEKRQQIMINFEPILWGNCQWRWRNHDAPAWECNAWCRVHSINFLFLGAGMLTVL